MTGCIEERADEHVLEAVLHRQKRRSGAGRNSKFGHWIALGYLQYRFASEYVGKSFDDPSKAVDCLLVVLACGKPNRARFGVLSDEIASSRLWHAKPCFPRAILAEFR